MGRLLKIFKTYESYQEDAVQAILEQNKIFSCVAEEGTVTIKFSAHECMDNWETGIPVGDFLNVSLKHCDFLDSLLVCSEVGYNIAQTMGACAVKSGGKKRSIYTLEEESDGFTVWSEDNRLICPHPKSMIMVENSFEKIRKVLEIEGTSELIKVMIFVFGSWSEFNELCKLAASRHFLLLRALPLELLVKENMKKFF